MVKIIGHIALSVLFLFSATGTTINMHFSDGHLYDMAIDAPADDCCENAQGGNVKFHTHEIEKIHHCSDESIMIESSHYFLASDFSSDLENSDSFNLYSLTKLIIESPEHIKSFAAGIFNYKKPPPQEVVLAQIQSFLL